MQNPEPTKEREERREERAEGRELREGNCEQSIALIDVR
jgi:hypothetical protein